MQISSKRLGEILIEKGLITEDQLQEALQEQKMGHTFLGDILIDKGWINNKNLLEALAEQFGIPLVDLKTEYIDMKVASQFSLSCIQDHKCLPLRQDGESVTVAIVNPLDAIAISKIEQEAKPRKVNFVLASEEEVKEAIQNYHQYVSQGIRHSLKDKEDRNFQK